MPEFVAGHLGRGTVRSQKRATHAEEHQWLMKKSEREYSNKVFAIFAVAALIAFAFFNLSAKYLQQSVAAAVQPAWMAPFVVSLAAIAVGPFINRNWWETNYALVSYGLGLIIVVYYIFVLSNPGRLILTMYEYVSFISLIGSLFVVTGGIHIHVRGKATPWENIAYLGTGAILANVLGTTGASMVLIRPYLRANSYRAQGYHVVFFIFLVSNIGGVLTPVGDPPLFLGYLKGVPFFWIFSHVNEIWILAVGLVLLIFLLIDGYFYRRQPARVQQVAAKLDEPQIQGVHNIFFLLLILGSVFIERPFLLREMIMWASALGSYYTTKRYIHQNNEFSFQPIKEVAILFAGIFATMIPALDWLALNSTKLGLVTPAHYFWGSGLLSSVLDNAPTYLNFLSAAFGIHGANINNPSHVQIMLGLLTPASQWYTNPLGPGAMAIGPETWKYIQAVSVGAVFFGAMTYIGNGPISW